MGCTGARPVCGRRAVEAGTGGIGTGGPGRRRAGLQLPRSGARAGGGTGCGRLEVAGREVAAAVGSDAPAGAGARVSRMGPSGRDRTSDSMLGGDLRSAHCAPARRNSARTSAGGRFAGSSAIAASSDSTTGVGRPDAASRNQAAASSPTENRISEASGVLRSILRRRLAMARTSSAGAGRAGGSDAPAANRHNPRLMILTLPSFDSHIDSGPRLP
jgi:hypothetical protein